MSDIIDLSVLEPHIARLKAAEADHQAAIQEQIEERKARKQQKQEAPLPFTVSAAAIPVTDPRWLIYPYFQLGRLSIIAGDPGLGKSAFAMAIAAAVSSGKPFGKAEVNEPGDVIIASSEDDDGIVVGRLQACGADLNRCHIIKNTSYLTIASPILEEMIEKHQAKLLIIDPLHKYFDRRVDAFRANETGPMMEALKEMLERQECACVTVEHQSKGSGDYSPVLKVLGSVDIPGSARSVLLITRDPEAIDRRSAQNLVFHVKSNNAKAGLTMAYTIGERGGVEITGLTSMTYEEAVAIARNQKYAQAGGVSYDKSRLRELFNTLAAEHPTGGKWRYAELDAEAIRILKKKPWQNTNHLKRMVKEYQSEMAEKDGLLVEVGVSLGQHYNGVRLTIVGVPKSYQSSMELD